MPKQSCFVKKGIWSVLYGEIIDYISSLGNFSAGSDRIFTSNNLQVVISKLPDRNIGSISFPCTEVQIIGKEADVMNFYQKFLIQFLKGGG